MEPVACLCAARIVNVMMVFPQNSSARSPTASLWTRSCCAQAAAIDLHVAEIRSTALGAGKLVVDVSSSGMDLDFSDIVILPPNIFGPYDRGAAYCK